MEKAERDAILRQGVVLPETPRQRRELAALAEDSQSIPLTGKPLPVRARAFRPNAEAYLVATQGPLPYMAPAAGDRAAHGGARAGAARCLAALSRTTCGEDAEQFRDEWLAARTQLCVRRGERSHRAPQPLVPGRVATPDGSANRRIRARQRPRLSARAARRDLDPRAVSGRDQLGSGRRALTRASMASRSSPSTSRSTRSAFSISRSPGSSPAI